MAKTRTLPDKYYDKDYETNGIHRVPLWRIAGFALNNTATNLYLMFMNYVSFYLLGFVGVGMVMASSFTMAMRIWDGVTDPFIGYMVDKTNGKFGKNRPFMVIGNIILAASSFIMFHFTHKLPEGPARFIFFVVFCCIYYLGYTCQCVVTKSAQSCMTNDPKQRPMFASFDGVFNTILFTVLAIVVANIANKYADVGNYTSTQFFHEFWMMTAIMSAIFTVIAVISIAPKDRPEFFGTGKPIKVGLKDYWDTLKNNRAIQMLVVSASTDKLFMSTMSNSTVMICLFGIIFGNYAAFSSYSQITSIPIALISILLMNKIARQMGQKASMMTGTYGGIIGSIIITLFLVFVNPKGDASKFALPAFRIIRPDTWGTLFTGWSAVGLIFILLIIAWRGVQALSSSIVITMTADCADYEVYRTGKYVPGLMGTLFSFVDKLVSSLAATLVALFYSVAGFKDALPDTLTPYSDGIFWATIGCFVLLPIVGWLCNVVAMHFYPLTKEKMEEIQDEVAQIKMKAMAENA